MDVVDIWTGRHASALRTALRMTNESFARHLGSAVRTVANWEARPGVVLSPALQEVLDTALEQASSSAKQRFALLCSADEAPTGDSAPAIQTLSEAEFIESARESANDAALRSGNLADAIEAMRHQLIVTTRRYSHRSPASVFTDARHVRNVAYELMERTRRPSEMADLYVLAGAANAIMSSIAFDIGHWDAARTLVESGTSYAQLAGHSSLEAWTWGLQATLANWRRDEPDAIAAFERGIAVAPGGAPRFRLRHIAARTRSAIGDRAAVETLLNQSRSDRETADSQRDELAHEIGGEFAFGDARAAACAAAAWLELGQAELAEADAGAALDLYQQLEERARPFSPVNGLRIDVATARLLRIDVDGARHALGPVLTLEPAKRNSALVGRMSVMRAELSASRWTRDSVADDLLSTIDDWLRHSAAGHLPPDGIS
jgi:hypothetical protein